MLAHHEDGVEVIAPGALGDPFTVVQRAGLAPQASVALTHTLPVVVVPNDMVTELVPCPLLIVAPVGAVHI